MFPTKPIHSSVTIFVSFLKEFSIKTLSIENFNGRVIPPSIKTATHSHTRTINSVLIRKLARKILYSR